MSRRKSAQPAKAGGGPPPRRAAKPAGRSTAGGGARGVFVQKPKSDVYVALLGVSLGAILLGMLFLGLVMARYDFKRKVSHLDQRPAVALADPSAMA